MKKTITLLFSAFIMTAVGFAQSNTQFFVEEFTGASCGPCASQNPAFDALLAANDDKVVVLKYQTNIPGYDPMYSDNPGHSSQRRSYYGISGVPTAVGNGSLWPNDCGAWPGAPVCLSASEINAAYEVISPLTMEINGEVISEPDNIYMHVTGSITADQALSGSLRLRMAVAEQTILKSDAPGGTNSEQQYHHVMKVFIGGTSGLNIGDLEEGEVYNIDHSVSLNSINVYNYDELEVVAWVQDHSTREVFQSTKDQEIELISSIANNATAGDIEGLPLVLCQGVQTVTPVFTLINNGSETLTSADIIYTASGGASQTFNWTGSIESLLSEDVTLDPIDVVSNLWNEATIEVTVENPNGTSDDDIGDNSTTVFIGPAPEAGGSAELVIETDNYGDEIYWEIRNSAGDIIDSGGNPNVGLTNIGTGTFPPPSHPDMYGNATTYTEQIDLPDSDCYTFHITDYFGDGFLGFGGYTLRDSEGNVMHNNSDDFTIEAMKDFSSGAVGISENELEGAVVIGPNPVSDVLNVSINLDSTEDILVEMVNNLGQVVYTEMLNRNITQIDVSDLESGIYYLNFSSEETRISRKVNVIK